MKRGGAANLNYDWQESPHRPASLKAHLFAPDPRPRMTLVSGLCAIVLAFVDDMPQLRSFCHLNREHIAGLSMAERASLLRCMAGACVRDKPTMQEFCSINKEHIETLPEPEKEALRSLLRDCIR